MNSETRDPREIPVLTEAVVPQAAPAREVDAKALAAAILDETFRLADSLLQQSAKDIEASLLERVLGRLRAELPGLVERAIRDHVHHG